MFSLYENPLNSSAFFFQNGLNLGTRCNFGSPRLIHFILFDKLFHIQDPVNITSFSPKNCNGYGRCNSFSSAERKILNSFPQIYQFKLRKIQWRVSKVQPQPYAYWFRFCFKSLLMKAYMKLIHLFISFQFCLIYKVSFSHYTRRFLK